MKSIISKIAVPQAIVISIVAGAALAVVESVAEANDMQKLKTVAHVAGMFV